MPQRCVLASNLGDRACKLSRKNCVVLRAKLLFLNDFATQVTYILLRALLDPLLAGRENGGWTEAKC